MPDLTTFILARIAEDERDAYKLAETDRRPVLSLARTVNHPERILAECEAKRRIVTSAANAVQDAAEEMDTEGGWVKDGIAAALGRTLQLLALPYADHPDYDEAWRV